MNLKKLLQIGAIILLITLSVAILSGCPSREDADVSEGSNEERFDTLMDEIFADWVSGDALTMNYFLADPDSMGIERPETTFGEISTVESMDESRQETKDLAKKLDSFSYDDLRYDQKIVYDILRRLIDISEVLERDDDFFFYTGAIRPLTGIQVQLPVLLAEFNFYTVDDIERYLDLIGDTERYFNELIEFERERSKRGFFMNETNTDSIIEQIESFLAERETSLLITVFDYRIDNYDGLSSEQRDTFKNRNKDLVLNNVLIAYETLLDAMHELRGVGVNNGGLASLPDGSEYAHALLRLRVGTDKTADELNSLLADWMDKVLEEVIGALYNDGLIDKYIQHELGAIHEGTPESYIKELQEKIAKDFPAISPTQLSVIEVHESLQEHTSPAFYLAPAIDRYNENVVYINPSSINDDLFLFTVLAHESYPGHLYQTVYFRQHSQHPVRVSLSNTGYSEGWATYSEMRSYHYAGLDFAEANLLWNLRLYDLLLQARVDLGVNVLGWTLENVERMLSGMGIDNSVAESVYNMVVGIPLTSLNYSVGYIEMMELLDIAEALKERDFSLLEFHEFVLNIGPSPYPIIRNLLIEQFEASSQEEALQPAA